MLLTKITVRGHGLPPVVVSSYLPRLHGTCALHDQLGHTVDRLQHQSFLQCYNGIMIHYSRIHLPCPSLVCLYIYFHHRTSAISSFFAAASLASRTSESVNLKSLL